MSIPIDGLNKKYQALLLNLDTCILLFLLEAELLFSEGKERKELFSEICMLLILQV
jgi:hypothetical protein